MGRTSGILPRQRRTEASPASGTDWLDPLDTMPSEANRIQPLETAGSRPMTLRVRVYDNDSKVVCIMGPMALLSVGLNIGQTGYLRRESSWERME